MQRSLVPLFFLATPALAGTAHFDSYTEGAIGTSFTESGITFMNLDNTLQPIGTALFICEEADGTLTGYPGFSTPNCLGSVGWSPGPGASFGRTKSYEIWPAQSENHASLELFLGGSYAGNTVTLEAYLGTQLVAGDTIIVSGGFPEHHRLEVTGVSFDHLRLIGNGAQDSGVFFGLVDDVTVDSPVFDSECAGDGTLTACPCSNNGQSGHGCENSAGTGGAELTANGNVAPDTVVLHASGELDHATSIFLQGDALIAPVPFGDGLRCAGGVLKRLAVKNASGGACDYPILGDLPITQRSAQLGDPITTGSPRYYQTYYRDPSATFCASGGTYNITNGVTVHW
jgi:hypothetical protein